MLGPPCRAGPPCDRSSLVNFPHLPFFDTLPALQRNSWKGSPPTKPLSRVPKRVVGPRKEELGEGLVQKVGKGFSKGWRSCWRRYGEGLAQGFLVPSNSAIPETPVWKSGFVTPCLLTLPALQRHFVRKPDLRGTVRTQSWNPIEPFHAQTVCEPRHSDRGTLSEVCSCNPHHVKAGQCMILLCIPLHTKKLPKCFKTILVRTSSTKSTGHNAQNNSVKLIQGFGNPQLTRRPRNSRNKSVR